MMSIKAQILSGFDYRIDIGLMSDNGKSEIT